MADETNTDPKGGWNRRIGGLPLWGWSAIVAAGAVVGWVWYKNRQQTKTNNNTDQTNQSNNAPNDTSGLATDQYESIIALLQDLQGEEAQEPKTGPTGPPGPPGPPGPGESGSGSGGTISPPHTPSYIVYTVHRGDTLSGIAKKYHTTWKRLWDFNINPVSKGGAGRPAGTVKTLRKRGPNLLYAGEKIYIPRSK